MKVKELVKLLQKFNPEYEVVLAKDMINRDGEVNEPHWDIKEGFLDTEWGYEFKTHIQVTEGYQRWERPLKPEEINSICIYPSE